MTKLALNWQQIRKGQSSHQANKLNAIPASPEFDGSVVARDAAEGAWQQKSVGIQDSCLVSRLSEQENAVRTKAS